MEGLARQAVQVIDRMDPARSEALFAILGLDGPSPVPGAPLPPLFHYVYFWDARPPHELGDDGHPRPGQIIPDLGLPRRMWAGGRVTFHAPLRVGIQAERITTLAGFRRKTGRTGELGLVTLRHVVRQKGAPVLTEEQDLIYRPAPSQRDAAAVPRPAPEGEDLRESLTFDAPLLFRYSALTLNGHRIHYDLPYARSEGYPGLVVHGPLLAQLLALAAVAQSGRLGRFAFRATAPLIAGETAELCARGPRLWVRGPDGRLCMEAEAG